MKKLLLLLLLVSHTAFAGLVTKPYTFSNNTIADATQVNADYDTLYTLVNGNLDNANILAGAGIVFSKLDSATVAGVSASQTLTNKTLTAPILSGSITGTYTLAGTPTITAPTITTATLNDPTVTGTVSGSASYSTPTITSPSITGTISGTPTITTPVIASLYQDAAKTKLMTVPAVASDTFALINATQTLYNKTIDNPTFSGTYTLTNPNISGGTMNGTVIGGTTKAALGATTGTFTDDVSIAATKKFYLDGGSDTHISEVAGNAISLTTGGVLAAKFSNTTSGTGMYDGNIRDVASQLTVETPYVDKSMVGLLISGSQPTGLTYTSATVAIDNRASGVALRLHGGLAIDSGSISIFDGSVRATTTVDPAITGQATSTGSGVRGLSDGGHGVYGQSNASSSSKYGVYGYTGYTGTLYAVAGYGGSTGANFYGARAGITNIAQASSVRWKKNIKPIENALDKVLAMRGVTFDWDEAHGGVKNWAGFIAEEVMPYYPTVVVKDPENPNYATGMDYGAMTPLLLQAIKEQNTIIKSLEARILILESK